MGIPTPVKTYQFDVNTRIISGATPLTQQKTRLRGLKNKLLAFGNAPWTVAYSCSSTVAGVAGDGVDRWAADSDVVWATAEAVAHSWIVLKQVGVAANFQVCLSCIGTAAGEGMTARMSPNAGFTGGTTTATPTATDQVTLALGTDSTNASGTFRGWNPLGANGVADVMDVLQSTDGAVTRVLWYANSTSPAIWGFEQIQNPVTGWTLPFVGYVKSVGANNAAEATFARFTDVTTDANRPIKALGVSAMNLLWTLEGCSGASLGARLTVANDFSGEWPIFPLGVECENAGNRGRHGLMFDLWGQSSTGAGDTYPSDTSRQLLVHGNYLHPWNGTIATVT